MAEDKPKDSKKEESKKEEAKEEPSKEAPAKKGKDKDKDKEPKKEKMGEIKIQQKNLNLKPDFRYVVRIANPDIDGTRTVPYGLTRIDGIGIRVAEATVTQLGLPPKELLGNLSEEQVATIENAIQNGSKTMPRWMLNRQSDWEMGDTRHVFGSELDMKNRDDINMMKMIRCYRGIRHETGQKVRGQRTKSNGRSGLMVGVTRKTVLAAAKAAKDADKGDKGDKGGAKSAAAGAAAKKEEKKEEKKL
jgi:small subunit ribosomal protein S13